MQTLARPFEALYSGLCDVITRPPRDVYDVSDLGPTEFLLQDTIKVRRTDFQIKNSRGLLCECSIFHSAPEGEAETSVRPVVIYLHGNASSRLESLEAVPLLIDKGVDVVGIDLSGSGLSEGQYISLGYYEKDDVACLVRYLMKEHKVEKFGLWGRSMGAATALMVCAEFADLPISTIICDSSYSDLHVLILELAGSFVPIPIPKMLLQYVYDGIRDLCRVRSKFSLDDVKPIKNGERTTHPAALFVVAQDDEMINPHHGRLLYEAYLGHKVLIEAEGDHNSQRSLFVRNSIATFLLKHLLDNTPDHSPEHETIIDHHKVPHIESDKEVDSLVAQAVTSATDEMKDSPEVQSADFKNEVVNPLVDHPVVDHPNMEHLDDGNPKKDD